MNHPATKPLTVKGPLQGGNQGVGRLTVRSIFQMWAMYVHTYIDVLQVAVCVFAFEPRTKKWN